MAVTDLWIGKNRKPTSRHGRGKRWRVTVPGHPSRAFATKAEAQGWEVELLRRGRRRDGGVTVGQLVDVWLAGKAYLGESSLKPVRQAVVRVKARWEHVAAADVTKRAVQEWIAALQSEHGPRSDGARALRPAAASTKAKTLQALSGALEILVDEEKLDRNPCDGVKVGRQRSIDPRFLDERELSRLAAAAGEWASMMWLMGTTGVRIGECIGLDVADIDTARAKLRVRRSKSGRGRDVPIPEDVLQILPLRGRTGSVPLFTTSSGGRVEVRNWRARVFTPAARDAGLLPLRPHDLRHTAASLMIASGASIKDVQEALGHKTPSITLGLYGHRYEGHLADVAQRMNGRLTGLVPGVAD